MRRSTPFGVKPNDPSSPLQEKGVFEASTLPPHCSVKSRDESSVLAFATQYKMLAGKIGAGSVVLGSDFNGGITHLETPVCPTATYFDKVGLWNISHTGLLWNALKKLGAPVPEAPHDQVTTFLNAWAKLWSKH